MKNQIAIIHGGTTFNTYEDYLSYLKNLRVTLEYLNRSSWKDSLQDDLGDSYDVVKLQMPNKTNARYEEWKLYFEKYIPLFNESLALIGHSLGGLFLAKYLSENKFSKKIRAVYLIAAPHSSVKIDESLGDFILPHSLDSFSAQANNIFILFSEDDPLVAKDHAMKYKAQLPAAIELAFKDKQHFSMPEFPELAAHIKSIQDSE